MPSVDLDIDLGELPGEPAALFALATTANIACGGHAGDKASMARALSFAMARGIRVAAHPSYPDREGFGRVSLALAPAAIAAAVDEQCAALSAIAQKLGFGVTAIKPHGALYHDAAGHPAIAVAVIEGAARGLGVAPGALTVIGPPRGALLDEALRRGARYAREGFADRAYRADGTLAPRSEAGAVLTDADACARQALGLAKSGIIETICVHGDGKDAVAVASRVRDALAGAGMLAGFV